MGTSFKRTYAHNTVVFSAPDPAAGHCQPTSSPETPGHSQASMALSLVGTLLLFPGSWCTQGFVCAIQEFVSPVSDITVTEFISLGSKITEDGDCCSKIKTCLLFGRKAMTNLDSILKCRDVTLQTKVRLVKAMVFSVVMYNVRTGP